jgi:ArsR family transcriptional regulator, arsenate/arsenite/antimonite-responsive transcriptional repressor
MLDTQTLFYLLNDQTRLRSIVLLLREGELCVCELTHALEMVQPKVSRHLALLRDKGLVQTRREGQWIYYRIATTLPAWVDDILAATLKGVVGEIFTEDMRRLSIMGDRTASRCSA